MAWKCNSGGYGGYRPPGPPPPPPVPKLVATEERATHCAACGRPVDKAWKKCPMCTADIGTVRRGKTVSFTCGSCRKPVETDWKCCAFCGTAAGTFPAVSLCACGAILEPDHRHCAGCGAPRKR